MNKTIVTHLKDANDNLVGIKVKPSRDKEGRPKEFVIPVMDVRTANDGGKAIRSSIKEANIARGSKFMKTSYSLMGYRYN